jgi:Asp-tRNA(Asn)/Glu-tRNA(Gln) amidotransferase C subunit
MISEEEVRHVANLARLGLTDGEVKQMSGQLGAIIDSIDQIGELDLSDVTPTSSGRTSRGRAYPRRLHYRRPPTPWTTSSPSPG